MQRQINNTYQVVILIPQHYLGPKLPRAEKNNHCLKLAQCFNDGICNNSSASLLQPTHC